MLEVTWCEFDENNGAGLLTSEGELLAVVMSSLTVSDASVKLTIVDKDFEVSTVDNFFEELVEKSVKYSVGAADLIVDFVMRLTGMPTDTLCDTNVNNSVRLLRSDGELLTAVVTVTAFEVSVELITLDKDLEMSIVDNLFEKLVDEPIESVLFSAVFIFHFVE